METQDKLCNFSHKLLLVAARGCKSVNGFLALRDHETLIRTSAFFFFFLVS